MTSSPPGARTRAISSSACSPSSKCSIAQIDITRSKLASRNGSWSASLLTTAGGSASGGAPRWVAELAPAAELGAGQVERDRSRPVLSRLRRPVPVAGGHVEDPQPAQVLAEPAQQRAGLAIAAYVHLVPGHRDRVSNPHGQQIYAPKIYAPNGP